jgi:hypothetical protein
MIIRIRPFYDVQRYEPNRCQVHARNRVNEGSIEQQIFAVKLSQSWSVNLESALTTFAPRRDSIMYEYLYN